MSNPSPGAEGSWYALADDRVLARTIRELHYEGLVKADPLVWVGPKNSSLPDGQRPYRVVLSDDIRYDFVARRSAWQDLHVVPGSVTRTRAGQPAPTERSFTARFLLDAQPALDLGSMVLGNLLEEVHNTVASEARQCRQLHCGAEELSTRSGVDLERHLDAHPKIIGSRGRLGWGQAELRAYAPEYSPAITLSWLAAPRRLVQRHLAPQQGQSELLLRTLGVAEHERLRAAVQEAGLDPEHDAVIPVHPWQWQRFVQLQYAPQLACGQLVPLGTFGEPYRPRSSIRTLSPSSPAASPDLKLSLSIMNTSCYRGIAAEQVARGGALSRATAALTQQDPLLRTASTRVLQDLGGVHYLPPHVVPDGPYRYGEMLAAIWRQSAAEHLSDTEQEVSAAALYQRDLGGDPLVRHWIERSGWSAERWLSELCRRTVIPLYHLLCAHGLGIIAHGQNISVVLDGGRPQGMLLRDFHGDVRLVDEPWPEASGLPTDVTQSAARRPPITELVHDLFTGHFVSVLRFVAPVIEEALGLPERAFYAIQMHELRAYMDAHPRLHSRFAAAPLDRPTMERICVNRARFRIGYGDLTTRPLPDLGTPLHNPLSDH